MKTKLLFIGWLISISSLSFTQIIYVPGDHPTIQTGIDVATDGDTVLVAEGTYYENIRFKGKAISVASEFLMDGDESHIENTIIDGSQATDPDSASTVMFIHGEDTTSVLQGLTIRGGTGTVSNLTWGNNRIGGGILCVYSGAKLLNNMIKDNYLTHEDYAFGAGIGCYSGSDKYLVMEGNTIADNMIEITGIPANPPRLGTGGGAFVHMDGRIVGNMIEDNQCLSTDRAAGAGVEIHTNYLQLPSRVYFAENVVRNNVVSGTTVIYGCGINSFFSEVDIQDNLIYNNILIGENPTQNFGAGLAHGGNNNNIDTLFIQNNEFINNLIDGSTTSYGSAIAIINAFHPIIISGNLFQSNGSEQFDNHNGTIYLMFEDLFMGQNSTIMIDGNRFKYNRSYTGGALQTENIYDFSFTNNLVIGNPAKHGAALYLVGSWENQATPRIANNTFVGNTAETAGGAIFNNISTSPLASFNNLFWDNNALVGKDVYNLSTVLMLVMYSDIEEENIFGEWTGEGNFYQDPVLEDDSLHQGPGSPCWNAGTDSVSYNDLTFYSPGYDIDGDMRPMNGVVDVGADEILATGMDPQTNRKSPFRLVNHPNPFEESTTIAFNLPEDGQILIEVFDPMGKLVEILRSGYGQKGTNTILWKTSHLNEGVFLLRIESNGTSETTRLIHQ